MWTKEIGNVDKKKWQLCMDFRNWSFEVIKYVEFDRQRGKPLASFECFEIRIPWMIPDLGKYPQIWMWEVLVFVITLW